MNQTPKTTPFSISRFITSTLAYFVIFAGIISMFYLSDPTMLAYNFFRNRSSDFRGISCQV